jgi:hypothetical protein
MASINKKLPAEKTHEGGPARKVSPENQLRRSVMACMLWEKGFYESGEEISKRIADLVAKVTPEVAFFIANEAREVMNLRHVPLLIAREMARLPQHKKLAAKTISSVIRRADELTEFLAIYWKEGKRPLSAQVKKGLACAFRKFSEYDLAKYNRDGEIKLRDALFLCHAKPKDKEQAKVWKRLAADTLKTPDTWEVALSAGDDKKATWVRLMKEKKLGALALLRNLRNMDDAGVPKKTIRAALEEMNVERVLPYRFIAAARYAPDLEDALEAAMFRALNDASRIGGTTALLIDVSGSMDHKISEKSDLTRMDAACGLAILAREICKTVQVFTFSEEVVKVPNRRGFALRDAIVNSQEHSGTLLGKAVGEINGAGKAFDRLIVFSDEQTSDKVPNPVQKFGYMINVASNKNGVGYGPWIHFDGFSEAVVNFIAAYEE